MAKIVMTFEDIEDGSGMGIDFKIEHSDGNDALITMADRFNSERAEDQGKLSAAEGFASCAWMSVQQTSKRLGAKKEPWKGGH